MAILQPQGTQFLNTHDHAEQHRVFANDENAPAQSAIAQADGQVSFGYGTVCWGSGTTVFIRYDSGNNRLEANKAIYSEGKELGALGTYATKLKDTVYYADADGFILLSTDPTGLEQYEIYVDTDNPPTTRRIRGSTYRDSYGAHGPLCFPVPKENYWKVTWIAGTGPEDLWWIPLSPAS